MILNPPDIVDYEQRGYLFVPRLFSDQEVELLRQEIRKLLRERNEGLQFEKDGETPRTIWNPQSTSELFRRLSRHPRMLKPAMQLLQGEAYVFQLNVNFKSEFTGDVWWWHQDFPTYASDDGIPLPRMVNCLLFIDEVNEFNGPLMIVPGSHRADFGIPERVSRGTSHTGRYSSDADVRRIVLERGLLAPKGPAGCAIFVHTNLVHGSNCNMSPWPRALITLTYNSVHNAPTRLSSRSEFMVPHDLTPIEPLDDGCLNA